MLTSSADEPGRRLVVSVVADTGKGGLPWTQKETALQMKLRQEDRLALANPPVGLSVRFDTQ